MGDRLDATKSFLFENILGIASDYGSKALKQQAAEEITNQVVEMGVDTFLDLSGAMIPAIGGAISSFRTNKKIHNVEKLLIELNKRQEELTKRISEQTLENKAVLDHIFDMVLEKVTNFNQEDKIEYVVNGYSELLLVDNPSFDVAYLYYDTLDRLTILDISVLKMMYSIRTTPIEGLDAPNDFKEIMDTFGIDYDQYLAVRANLSRMGLVEDSYDNSSEKDIDSIGEAIGDLRRSVESIEKALEKPRNARIKKLTNKSNIKIKAKRKLVISKFGRDFVRFFLAPKSA